MTITATGGTRGRSLSSNRLIGAALAVSLALNLCVVAGALWSRFSAPPAPATASERFHKLETALHLTDEQRGLYHAYVATTLARTAQLRREIDPLLDAAWAEIAKPQPDDAYLMQRFDEAASRWRGFQHEAVEATLTLLAKLTPEQRERFVADENERRAAVRHRRLD